MSSHPVRVDYQKTIWEDDLLGRQNDAKKLEDYLVTRARRTKDQSPGKAFVLAIDAPYGAGKSDFLGRLYNQLSLSHPTSMIDAWVDDTIDNPWAALVVALDDALNSKRQFITPEKVKILGERGADLIRALSKGIMKQAIQKYVGNEAYDEVTAALFDKKPNIIVEEYKNRKSSIENMKSALRQLLDEEFIESYGQIIIFVDELDRCRPNYAISFLEQMKHILDINGIVFLLALNSNQLERSIKQVYGNEFDSQDYLRRFIDQYYLLPQLSAEKLIIHYIGDLKLPIDKLSSPIEAGTQIDRVSTFINLSVQYWNVHPRNIIRIIDRIALFCDVWPYACDIRLEYLFPLMLQDVMRVEMKTLLELPPDPSIITLTFFEEDRVGLGAKRVKKDLRHIFQRYAYIASQQDDYLYSMGYNDAVDSYIFQIAVNDQHKIGNDLRYPNIIRSYSRLISEFSG